MLARLALSLVLGSLGLLREFLVRCMIKLM